MALTENRKSVLYIVADAFRSDYLEPQNTPFLCSLAEKGTYVKKLRPNFGFCERTEMFTGTRPDENDFFTALTFGDEGSAFAKCRADISLLSLFDWKTKFLRRYIRRFFRDWFSKVRKVSQPVYEIPLKLLPLITLTEDVRDLQKPGWSNTETIFDVVRETGKSFYFDTFASLTMKMSTDDDRTEHLCRVFPESDYDFYLAYIGDGDGTGHQFGPSSEEAIKMTRRVDDRIKKIAHAFFESFPAGKILVIGDHGMLEVVSIIDMDRKIMRIASSADLRLRKDFDYFLDSTLTRIWFRTAKAENAFSSAFEKDHEINANGKIITRDLAASLHIPFPGCRYGDLMWMANPGILIFPDFFHYRRPCRGMHGYETQVPGQKGFAVASGTGIQNRYIDEAELIDVCPSLCRLLEIREPEQNRGKSFIES